MKLDAAAITLGLTQPLSALTREIVMEAFRKQCKLFHPDTLAAATAEPLPAIHNRIAVHTIQELTIAKKTLLDAITGADLACKLCRGTGKVPAKMGLRTCAACNGTGDRR